VQLIFDINIQDLLGSSLAKLNRNLRLQNTIKHAN